MSRKPRGLGAGFAALISQPSSAVTQTAQDRLMSLPVEKLIAGRFQPRTQWDESRLMELSESIRSQGVVQPIVVRLVAPQQYEIIAGERRWRAAQLAGLVEVPVLLKQMDDQEALAVALIENIQREDLSAIEEARAIKKLLDLFSLTHEQIAQSLGRSRESISNLLRLLKLSDSVQESVLDGSLSAGHARALLALDEHSQQRLAQQAISLEWSVRDMEIAVKSELTPAKNSGIEEGLTLPVEIQADMQVLQDRVAQKVGADVRLKVSPSGRGKIEISFKNQQELQSIMSFF